MKKLNFLGTLVLTLAVLASTGCHRKPYNGLTPLPDYQTPSGNQNANPNQPPPTGGDLTSTPPVTSDQNIPLSSGGQYAPLFEGPHNEDRDTFKSDTVYFDFDSSTIKPAEESKLQAIADHFKGDTRMEALIIEGNCDERGTEKYNLSLGERRALAAREYLVNLGMSADRIKTVTYGASRPADPGHDESAWKQNRRDEFVLITPK